MQIVRSQSLFLDSAQRVSGNTNRWTVSVPPGLLRCQRSERMRVQLTQFSVFFSFQKVWVGNNSFAFVEIDTGVRHDVELTPGNYTMYELCRFINNAYAGVNVQYAGYEDGLIFEFEKDHRLEFNNDSWDVLGFLPTDVMEGEAFGSTTTVDMSPIDTVALAMDGMTAINSTNCVAVNGVVRQTNLLALVPIAQTPYDYVNVTPSTDACYCVDVVEKDVNELTFSVTHADGTAIRDMPDYRVSIRVDVVRETNSTENLLQQLITKVNGLLEIVRLAFVSKYLDKE